MGDTYRSFSITPDLRDKIPNRTIFDTCEDCNNANYEVQMNIKFYTKHKLALCDACVDSRDGLKWRNKKDYSKNKRR